MASTNFESQLNAAIEEKGYRISPRLSLEDRLARYIQLSWSDRGDSLNSDEIKAVAAMMLLKNSEKTDWTDLDNQTKTNDSFESHTTSEPRRSSRLANRIVTTNNDNLRITFATGSHPMMRRSQVMRR